MKTNRGSKKIGIWAGPAWEKWDLNSYCTAGLGGSETCAGRLAQTAAANGHAVLLFGEHERGEQDGVTLVPWHEFEPQAQEFDLFIASRSLVPVNSELRAKKVLVWVHDCALISGQEIGDFERAKVDKFVCLSPWHAEYFADSHAVEKSQIVTIPNGVNVELFGAPRIENKVFGMMIWSSSPDRGLDNLLYCLPWIKDSVPEIHLDIYYGFGTWEKSIRQNDDKNAARHLDELQKQIARTAEYVFWKDRVPQTVLAAAWGKAYLWGYPTSFHETYCITAKEAQVSATPIVCSNVAALQTTVGDHGLRLEAEPQSKAGRIQFINAVIALCRDRELWEVFSERSCAGAQRLDWQSRWKDFWEKWLPAS